MRVKREKTQFGEKFTLLNKKDKVFLLVYGVLMVMMFGIFIIIELKKIL